MQEKGMIVRRGSLWISASIVAMAGCADAAEPAGPSVQLSGNWDSTCAVDEAGSLRCWGALKSFFFEDPSEPRTTPALVADGSWIAASTGIGHACAIRADHTLWCWGKNLSGQLGDGTFDSHVEPAQVGDVADWVGVAVGGGHSCAIREGGALFCWGGVDLSLHSADQVAASYAASPFAIAGAWKQVSARWDEVCAIAADGGLWCWGDSLSGTVDEPFTPPTRVGADRWRTMTLGFNLATGVKEDGSLWTVSFSDEGASEARVGDDLDWETAVAGGSHICAIRVDGSLWCFGENSAGQLGSGFINPDTTESSRVGTATDWRAVAAGASHTCGARAGGEVLCWGSNAVGQLGVGDRPFRPAPTRVGLAAGWSSPAITDQSSCAIHGTTVLCWGYSSSGELGGGAKLGSLTPVPVMGSFTSVVGALFSVCAIRTDKQLVCWGNGQATPSLPLPGTLFSRVGGSEGKPCAITDDGRLFCWSDGYSSATQPVEIPGNIVWSQIATSSLHACGLDTAGALYCWGNNNHGELGLGDYDERAAPALLSGKTWLAIAVGAGNGSISGYSCGITDDGGQGRLFCWGSEGGVGRLGDGVPFGDTSVPQQVGTDGTWVSVAAGPTRACAIRNDGSLWCWGDNRDGGVGVGAADGSPHVPVQIGLDIAWSDVAIGRHTCATATDGSLWCWGYGPQGQLGDETAWRVEPTPVVF